MLFSLLEHYLHLYISDTVLKVFRSLYCFTTSIFHGVENYFPRLWGASISDAIFEIIAKDECLLAYLSDHQSYNYDFYITLKANYSILDKLQCYIAEL